MRNVAPEVEESACLKTVRMGRVDAATTEREVLEKRRASVQGTEVRIPITIVRIMARGTLRDGLGSSWCR